LKVHLVESIGNDHAFASLFYHYLPLEQGAYNISNDSVNGHVSCKSFPKIETIFCMP
jgi:hypothetical protein